MSPSGSGTSSRPSSPTADAKEELADAKEELADAKEQLTDSSQDSSAVTKEKSHAGKTIWIVGHSYVYWAEQRATRCPYGTQLDLPKDKCKVYWFGQKDLLWSGMQQLIAGAARKAPAPDILVLHAGGNDLVRSSLKRLSTDIKKDIGNWIAMWPGLKVVWSRIIQRQYWQNVANARVVEKARKKVNTNVASFLCPRRGCILGHDDICFKSSTLYRADGVLLSDAGSDCFNKSLQQLLRKLL